MDEATLSQQLFGKARIVRFRNEGFRQSTEAFLARHQAKIEAHLGRNLWIDDIIDLSGIPNEAEIKSLLCVEENGLRFAIDSTCARFGVTKQQRSIRILPRERTIINEELILKETHQGRKLGTHIFAHQAHKGRSFGFDFIQTTAVRGKGWNGYYTWPILGFDASLGNLSKKLRRKFSEQTGLELPESIQSIQDLMEVEAVGIRLWRDFGETADMQFDLRPDSRSWQILTNYLELHHIKPADEW